MFFVLRAIDERHDALVQFLFQEPNLLAIVFKFNKVAFLELHPLFRVVAKPFPERRTGGNVLEPQINACLFLC
jgi:hypothetical protein